MGLRRALGRSPPSLVRLNLPGPEPSESWAGGSGPPTRHGVGGGGRSGSGGPGPESRGLALRQLGRSTEGRAVQDELVERFPERAEAVEILFARADASGTGETGKGPSPGIGPPWPGVLPQPGRAGPNVDGPAPPASGPGRRSAGGLRGLPERIPRRAPRDEAGLWAGRTLIARGAGGGRPGSADTGSGETTPLLLFRQRRGASGRALRPCHSVSGRTPFPFRPFFGTGWRGSIA